MQRKMGSVSKMRIGREVGRKVLEIKNVVTNKESLNMEVKALAL